MSIAVDRTRDNNIVLTSQFSQETYTKVAVQAQASLSSAFTVEVGYSGTNIGANVVLEDFASLTSTVDVAKTYSATLASEFTQHTSTEDSLNKFASAALAAEFAVQANSCLLYTSDAADE